MATSPETTSMALFCDFENVAIGVRDAKYERFDIKRVLERLLLKGSIVVKKAYCDWDRYKTFKAVMHEANFELIEIPHARQSGKNSADIRLVVDALDLCYTKSHVNTFVIISGDSDFSPLVSKLRENAKQVIGVGVKQSTSDLLIANCDEFIFYDDLVRESERASARRSAQEPRPAGARPPEEDARRKEEAEARKRKAVQITVETFEALMAERGDGGRIWPSMIKQAIKRQRPDFSEAYFGFRSFSGLLEEAQARGMLELGRDEKGNIHVLRGAAPSRGATAPAARPAQPAQPAEEPPTAVEPMPVAAQAPPAGPQQRGAEGAAGEPPGRSRGTRKTARRPVSKAKGDMADVAGGVEPAGAPEAAASGEAQAQPAVSSPEGAQVAPAPGQEGARPAPKARARTRRARAQPAAEKAPSDKA